MFVRKFQPQLHSILLDAPAHFANFPSDRPRVVLDRTVTHQIFRRRSQGTPGSTVRKISPDIYPSPPNIFPRLANPILKNGLISVEKVTFPHPSTTCSYFLRKTCPLGGDGHRTLLANFANKSSRGCPLIETFAMQESRHVT